MKEGLTEHWVKQLVAATVGKCSVCNHDYDAGNVSVLGHKDDLWFLTLMCTGCHSQGLVAAVVHREAAIAGIADLLRQKLDVGTPPKQIGQDDVQEIHQFLSEFNGDFKGLFGHAP